MSVKLETTYINALLSKKLQFFMTIILQILCLSLIFSTSIMGRPLSRTQRQTITGELASGLTKTGTSFNSWPNGYNSALDGYQQQQETSWNPYKDQTLINGKMFRKNRFEPSLNQYVPTSKVTYDGIVSSNWRGFGTGKNPYGTRPVQPQYGVKY